MHIVPWMLTCGRQVAGSPAGQLLLMRSMRIWHEKVWCFEMARGMLLVTWCSVGMEGQGVAMMVACHGVCADLPRRGSPASDVLPSVKHHALHLHRSRNVVP